MNNTLAQHQDGFALAAESTNNAPSRLAILKHRKGIYEVHGTSGGTIPLNSKFLVLNVMHGWVRIEKGKKIQRIAREPGKHFPDRNELGDMDQDKWPVGLSGEPSDPWMIAYDMHIKSLSDGRGFLFTTNNKTGCDAVRDFAEAVVWQRQFKGPNAKPIVELGSRTFIGRYGPVAVPDFRIVDWFVPANGAEAPVANTEPEKPQTIVRLPKQPKKSSAVAPSNTSLADELDDELPF